MQVVRSPFAPLTAPVVRPPMAAPLAETDHEAPESRHRALKWGFGMVGGLAVAAGLAACGGTPPPPTPPGSSVVVVIDKPPTGQQAARQIQNDAGPDVGSLNGWFGEQLPVETVHVLPGDGGAWHYTNNYPTIYVTDTTSTAPGFASAEYVETAEAMKANGWDPLHTNGEALSRALAYQLHPEVAAQFSGDLQTWLDHGAPDVITQNQAKDTDLPSDAAGTAFIYYMHDSMGYSYQQIINAGGPNLGATYATLTGHAPQQGYQDFVASLSHANVGADNGNPYATA
ncbi:MAG: hypothetical protein ACYCW6_05280 [Candidatus Xenobia bacterium]